MITQQSPEYYAKDIINSFELKVPIDIYGLCKKFNIDIFYEDLSDAEAYFISKNANKKIIINKKIQYDSRVKFTIAHEIGHFYLPWHNYDIFKCSTGNIFMFKSNDILENEANTFASELLTPKDDIIKGIKYKDITLKLIKDLALMFGVSLTSVAIKVINNTSKRAAIVFSKDGRIKWSFTSDTFKRNVITNTLRQWSFAYDFFAERNDEEVIDTVYSMAWLEDGSDDESLIEESLPMPNLNSVLTILKLPENDYGDEDEI